MSKAAIDISEQVFDGDGPPLPKIGSLDLSTVRADREANKAGLSGEHHLGVSDIPMSPRAQSEAVRSTPPPHTSCPRIIASVLVDVPAFFPLSLLIPPPSECRC
jgi:hypothetical protein